MRRIAVRQPEITRRAAGVFDEGDLSALPEPVARFFGASIRPGTPLAQTAEIAMRGRIKLNRWTRFAGVETITPSVGFVWAVRAGLISGYDRYAFGEREMRWKLIGLIPVVHVEGPDVARSAAARVAGEAVWLPTALLPRFGVRWEATTTPTSPAATPSTVTN